MKLCKDCKFFYFPFGSVVPAECLATEGIADLVYGLKSRRKCHHERMPPPHSTSDSYDFIMHDKRCGQEGRNFVPKEPEKS